MGADVAESATGTTLRATLFDASGRDREVDLSAELVAGLDEHHLLWVDLDNRGEEAIAALTDALDLRQDTSTLLAADRAVPKLLRYPDRVHLRLVAMQPGDDHGGAASKGAASKDEAVSSSPIDIIVAPNMVVTVHQGAIRAFDAFGETVRGDSRLGALHAADFLNILVDSVLAVYLELVEAIERKVDALDEVAVRATGDDGFLREVVGLRRRIAALRRGLAPHRWAFAPLARPDFAVEGLGEPWPGVMDSMERAMAAVENARELLLGAFDVYMARSAQRTNDVMKALTVLSAILLPAVVIGGVMGMNFKIGFFENPDNFWLALGGMATLAVVVLAISRWRGWI
jgi:magnesium transporter